MAAEAKTEKITVMVDGQEMELDVTPRYAAQTQGLIEAQKQAAFKETRDAFTEEAVQAVEGAITDEQVSALSDMALIVYVGTDADPVLTEASKVVVKQRAPKAKAAEKAA